MRQLSTLLLILFVIFSCSKNTSEEVKEAVTISDDFTSYTLDSELPAERFADLIESVEVMRLEETSNSLLSYVFDVHKTKDHLVFTSGRESNVFVFDMSGNFVRKINRKGEGPEEYLNITDLWLEGDTLAIYSRNQSTVKRYDLEGNFVKADKLPVTPGHINGYNNGYAMDMDFQRINDTSYYRFATLDKDLKLNGMYVPGDNKITIALYLSTNSVAPYKNGVTMHRMMSDTVYYLNEKGFNPLIHLDFGNDWYWKEIRDVTEEFLKNIQSTDKIWTATAKIGNDKIWVFTYTGSIEGRMVPSFLIDRATGQVHKVDTRKADKSNNVAVAISWDDDQLLYSIQSADVADFLSELNEDQIKFRQGTTLKEIESSENPVLMWVKFKNF